MHKKLLEILNSKSSARYIIGGSSVTILNVLLYHFWIIIGIGYKEANLIAIILSKIYGFFINKLFVYKSKNNSVEDLFAEVVRFIISRGFTGLIDYLGLLVCVEMFEFDRIISKYVLQVVVIVVNYLLGKIYVFRGQKEE